MSLTKALLPIFLDYFLTIDFLICTCMFSLLITLVFPVRLLRSTLEAGISRLVYFQKSTSIPASQQV